MHCAKTLNHTKITAVIPKIGHLQHSVLNAGTQKSKRHEKPKNRLKKLFVTQLHNAAVQPRNRSKPKAPASNRSRGLRDFEIRIRPDAGRTLPPDTALRMPTAHVAAARSKTAYVALRYIHSTAALVELRTVAIRVAGIVRFCSLQPSRSQRFMGLDSYRHHFSNSFEELFRLNYFQFNYADERGFGST